MLERIVELRQNEENAKKRSNAKTARSKSGMQEQTERKLERERMWETKKKSIPRMWILEIDWKDEKESKGNLRGKFVNRGVEQRGRRSQSEPPLLAPTCPLWTMRIPYLLLINHYGHFLDEMRFFHSLDIIRL